MQRLVLTSIFALGLATGVSAQLEEDPSPESTEAAVAETLEFVGNPVYTSDGAMIGVVSSATTETTGDRLIHVDFDDNFITEYAGWEFELDEKWKTTGDLTVLWTEAQLREWIDANGETQKASD